MFTQGFGLFPLADDKALDIKNFYDLKIFNDVLDSLTKTDRANYLVIHVFDYLFMISFYPLLSLIFTYIYQKDSPWSLLVGFPLLALLCDFLENISMDIHLVFYPTKIEFIGYIAGIFTFLKFAFLYVSIVAIIVSVIYIVIKGLRK